MRRRELAERVGRGVIALLGLTAGEGRFGASGFRQDSDFYYLTGHSEPGAALLIVPARRRDPYREIFFLPAPSSEWSLWTGPAPGSGRVGPAGFDELQDAAELGAVLRALAKERKPLLSSLSQAEPHGDWNASRSAFERLQDFAGSPDIRTVRSELAAMRSVKSAAEIDLLQRAVDATEAAHRAAWQAVRPGNSERSVASELVAAALKAGCDRMAFPPMAGSGPNATILHYESNRSILREGQLLLVDAGGERSRYAADIARTVPVGGRFGRRQRRLYEAVHAAQRAVIEAARPGVRLNGPGPGSLQSIAERTLRALAPPGVKTLMPHALGHHVGLDVHDPAPRGGELQPGMVVAIEPGLYLPEEGMGIRIEDMVRITEDGCHLMSGRLPSVADEIERALAA